MASSLLFPVVSTIHPRALDTAMRSTPRIRDWQVLVGEPGRDVAQRTASTEPKRDVRRLDGDVVQVDAELFGQGGGVGDRPRTRVARRHRQAVHVAAPSASTATAATSDESTPPDSPITASTKPFFVR